MSASDISNHREEDEEEEDEDEESNGDSGNDDINPEAMNLGDDVVDVAPD